MGSKCCGIHHQFKDIKQAKSQLALLNLNQQQIRMLHLIYSDLAERVIEKAITLQNFVLFFHKNGFWGERLFKEFDYTQSNIIVEKQFIIGITKIFKTDEQKKIELLYKFFSLNNKKKTGDETQKSSQSTAQTREGISFENFLIMLYNYPRQDLKKILNDKQFFEEQLRGSLKLIGQNRRLQSVYKMGSYVNKKKPIQCRIQQKSQNSDRGSNVNISLQPLPSIGSMVGRNILKHLKQDKAGYTNISFEVGQNIVQIKTNNIHHLVKRYAMRMFRDLKIDIKTQKMSKFQFESWISKHRKLYQTYYSGFHNQVWQLDESTQRPMYMNCVFQKKAFCQYINPNHDKRGQKTIRVCAIILHSIIIITHQKDLSDPYQTICLEGLAVSKVKDSDFGYGITITHRDGIYIKRQLFFYDQSIQEEWFEALKYFKGESIQSLYTLTKKIGAGKFSVVYEGIEKTTGQKYAIKVIESYKLESQEKDLIAHQTSIMQVLSHPLLVRFKDSIQTKTHLYIIAELCVGKDLFQFVKDCKHLTQYDASIITQQMIVGLRYMHSLGIVHRDIKPQNIMVSYENNKITKIKIIDFGFANYLDRLQELPPQQNLAGTPNYIAPEILRRDTISFKVDIFALGTILYYMLSGSLPFNDYSLTEIFNKTLDGAYQYPQKLFNHVSQEAKNLIDQLLKNKPEQRIELEQALKHPWFKLAQQNKDKNTEISDHHIPAKVY